MFEVIGYVGNGIMDNADKLCDKFQDKSRFIELPCKIGDVVYSLYHWWRKEDGIVPYQITNLTITQNKKGEWKKKYRAMWLVDGKTRDWSLDFGFDEIGKKAFLTREAAEAAIKEKNHEDN
jgi:hypothetical protein